MELELFNFIQKTIKEFEINQPTYSYVEGVLKQLYESMFQDRKEIVLDVHSRIKGTTSLQEKLIRNKFYTNYSTAEEALDNLTDLIGITIECRFIRNETELYEYLFHNFLPSENSWHVCISDPNAYLNLKMSQP